VIDVARGWWNADTFEKGAALSYYIVFSAAPIALLTISFAGMAFGDLAAKGMLFSSLSSALGHDVASAIEAMLASARRPRLNSFTQLKYSLNQIFQVTHTSDSAAQVFIRRQIAAFLVIVFLGILLLTLLGADIAIAAAGNIITRWVSVSPWWQRGFSFTLSLFLLTIVFFLLLKLLPDSNPRWKPALSGAVVTAGLFTVGKTLLSFYLGKTAVASVYGAAGSIIVLLLAAYYFSQIFFLGAILCRELTLRERQGELGGGGVLGPKERVS
jgi:membrane protein